MFTLPTKKEQKKTNAHTHTFLHYITVDYHSTLSSVDHCFESFWRNKNEIENNFLGYSNLQIYCIYKEKDRSGVWNHFLFPQTHSTERTVFTVFLIVFDTWYVFPSDQQYKYCLKHIHTLFGSHGAILLQLPIILFHSQTLKCNVFVSCVSTSPGILWCECWPCCP